ncbi:hypothetical protein [Bradyrhizobium valentinum]|uniref:Phosphatidic acid phosphatase type 2/haloperoxidase domain-containing protein n=1 Tax=Bradyrhizobium valentinum TaxID=1518501 RepID=A0A0R3KE94_9BRAD|nr:hypothetical protein [Bradyrhizobium valentinum]KRQ93960.1 hypothetical protein CP49_26590 [Bradyrhizobium valentinum]KRR01529.1 hypothetical protein CQ10_20255 [Bradyrhizobium valentinum]
MDFTPDDAGSPAFPHDYLVNPYQADPFLEWTTEDWDPALRFWTLPYDLQLTQWLKAVDPTKPSILAACEFGGQKDLWLHDRPKLIADGWLEADDLAWQPDPDLYGDPGWDAEKLRAWNIILCEIRELQQFMVDDRERYLSEIDVQADGLADYFLHFIGASEGRHPWTIELVNCGLAIGNIAYMSYKQKFKRVRPSFLCPGLIPAFGPPAHPAFPSGHSFLGHFIALLLLEIPALYQRYGIFSGGEGDVGGGVSADTLEGRDPIPSPMFWLSQRLAKNRERLGVHYPSDSFASRHLAFGIWYALRKETTPRRIVCPTLERVLSHATAEWPTDWS